MFFEREGALFGGSVPELNHLVVWKCHHSFHIGHKLDSLRGSAVTSKTPQKSLGGHVEETHGPLFRAGSQELAIGAKWSAEGAVLELVEGLDYFIGLRVVELNLDNEIVSLRYKIHFKRHSKKHVRWLWGVNEEIIIIRALP